MNQNRNIKAGCRVGAVILSCLILVAPAQSASFDCVKATTKVENLICTSAELSNLDDDLNSTYKNALRDEKQADSIQQAQKQWMKERNRCSDAVCVKHVYELRIQALSSIAAHTLPDIENPAKQTDQPPVKNEAEKAQRVKAILGKYPLNFNAEDSAGLMFYPDLPEAERNRLKSSPQYQAQTAEFCTAFYGAMQRADKAIQYVEPIVRPDDPNHPGLAQYHSCADAQERPNWREGRGEEIYDHISLIGDRAFRLYQLDLDGNSKNGLEEYLYAELDIKQTLAITPGYNRIDFERCEFMNGISVYQDQELHSGWHRNNYNAMIRYRDGYYIFDLYNLLWSSDQSPYYRLKLYRYSPQYRKFVTATACNFRD
ncbi:MAG: lysozyme inhibitor LprI family protein [Methylobacter sp.]